MTAYLICTVHVDDPETYKLYTARTPALIAMHGGRFLVRGGPVETLEGPPFGDRLVVVEFASAKAARALYESAEYREAMAFRHKSSQATFLLAEGVPADETAPADNVAKSD